MGLPKTGVQICSEDDECGSQSNSHDSSTTAPSKNTTGYLAITDSRTGNSIQVPIQVPLQSIITDAANTTTNTTSNTNPSISIPDTPYIDASQFKKLGITIYDPFFQNTAVTQSTICFVDGEAGRLLYRGFPIEQLVESKCTFLQVAFLLIYGYLPNKIELEDWNREIMTHTFVHVKLNELMKTFHYDAHPTGMFISTFAAMSTFHPEANPSLNGANIFVQSSKLRNKQIKRIIGKATTVAANAYRHRIGRDFNAPKSNLSYVENFLYMLDSLSEPEYKPHPVLVEALETLFIIHAEHEMNCSTATMRQIGSSLVDPYSAVAGATAALYGPLHGGANEAVLTMLEEIGSVDGVVPFIEMVKRKEKKLMGFGHRIYKNYDPRANLVRTVVDKVFAICGKEPLLDVAMALEKAALEDEYFRKRKLYPNVDFYSGLIYKAMGFPPDFFPLLFAVPRIAGWLAHWKEQMELEQGGRIWRPRQIYTGPSEVSKESLYQLNIPSNKPSPPHTSEHQALYRRYEVSKEYMQMQ